MSVFYQSYFILNKPGENISKESELYTLYYLFQIFKELHPKSFKINKGSGRPKSYTSDIMFPFIQWGHLNKMISCRDLEKWWIRNDETCNFVLNCKKPSKNTINRFLNANKDLIKSFNHFIVEFSIQTGLIEGKTIYHDGTILKGYCNNFKRLYADQIKHLKNFILDHQCETGENELWYKLEKYFNFNEFTEDVKPVLDDLKKIIPACGLSLLESIFTNKNGLENALLKIKEMEKNIRGKRPVSIVDPEAHSMLNKKGEWVFGYNYQAGVDDKYGMIVLHYITQSANDLKELLIVKKHLDEILGEEDYVIVVDNGYWHLESLKEICNSPTTIIIPDKTGAICKKEEINAKIGIEKKKEFKKHEFTKDWDNDEYICPNGFILIRQKNVVQNGVEYKVYRTTDCLSCPDQKICAPKYKREIKDRDDQEIDEIKRLYYSEWGQNIYYKRGSHAEGIFGILLEARNFRGIKTRGIESVNTEMTLHVITHNIKKIHKHMTNDVLKRILNLIKIEKKKHRNVDINIINKLIKKFIINDDVIIDFELR